MIPADRAAAHRLAEQFATLRQGVSSAAEVADVQMSLGVDPSAVARRLIGECRRLVGDR